MQGAVIISSEPLTENEQNWVPVPSGSAIVITPELTVLLHTLQIGSGESCAAGGGGAADGLPSPDSPPSPHQVCTVLISTIQTALSAPCVS